MSIAHSNFVYAFWCPNCQLALHHHEVDRVVTDAVPEFVVCGACSKPVDPYTYQDDIR